LLNPLKCHKETDNVSDCSFSQTGHSFLLKIWSSRPGQKKSALFQMNATEDWNNGESAYALFQGLSSGKWHPSGVKPKSGPMGHDFLLQIKPEI